MPSKEKLSKEQIFAALARLDELLREKSLLHPKVRFFIEETFSELNTQS